MPNFVRGFEVLVISYPRLKMKNNMKYTILISGEPYLFWSGNGVFLGLIALSYFAMFCNTANNASRLNENDDDFHRIEEQYEVTSPE